MKLKHGPKFGKRSASTWRLLFVFALMPWLRKYRILGDLEKDAKSFENMQVEKLRKHLAKLKAKNSELMDKIEEKEQECVDEDLSCPTTGSYDSPSKSLLKKQKDKDL